MVRIGLTGGIASGKSAVARLLAARGLPVVDADALAREVVEPGTPGFAAIAARWPQVTQGGRLDRKALGAIVFARPEERRALEAITHPAIRAAAGEQLAKLEAGGAPYAIYEAALLFENDVDRDLDATILVSAPEEMQVARLGAREGLGEAEALQRLRAQMPLVEKRARATFVLDNDGSLDDLSRRTLELWREVEKRWPRRAPG